MPHTSNRYERRRIEKSRTQARKAARRAKYQSLDQ